MPVTPNPKQTCVHTLKDKLKIKLEVSDVKYATQIGGVDQSLIKMVFKHASTRNEIYKARSKLKGSNIWITEDLTPRRAQLAYKARQAVKRGEAQLTWTNEGKIFVKKNSSDRPIIVNDETGLSVNGEATPTNENS
jgi:hypothetical protein